MCGLMLYGCTHTYERAILKINGLMFKCRKEVGSLLCFCTDEPLKISTVRMRGDELRARPLCGCAGLGSPGWGRSKWAYLK